MEWFNGARWRLSLSHCLEGLLIQIPVALLFGLTTGTVTGNSNHFECASTAGLEKTVDSRLGASVSATAAASQQGDAQNSGASQASAMGDGK